MGERPEAGFRTGETMAPYRVLGIDKQWWFRRLRSGLSPYQADVLACMIGLHPCLIWTTWFDDGLAPGEMA
jgi:hypothetical protein